MIFAHGVSHFGLLCGLGWVTKDINLGSFHDSLVLFEHRSHSTKCFLDGALPAKCSTEITVCCTRSCELGHLPTAMLFPILGSSFLHSPHCSSLRVRQIDACASRVATVSTTDQQSHCGSPVNPSSTLTLMEWIQSRFSFRAFCSHIQPEH